jgi:hypothetical protein
MGAVFIMRGTVPPGFVQSLVDYAELKNDVTLLTAELDLIFAQLQGGTPGSTLVSATVNGQSFGFSGTMTLEDKFRAFADAIKIYNAEVGSSPFTFVDFSQIS